LQVYQFNVPTFGKGVVFDVDSKIRAEQFKFFASALQSSKLKSIRSSVCQGIRGNFAVCQMIKL